MKKSFFKQLITLVTTGLFLSSILLADRVGKLEGRVMDMSGKSLSGVNILISELSFHTVTDLDGKYSISNIPKGIYTIKFTRLGFEEVIVKDVKITRQKTTIQNISLKKTIPVGELLEIENGMPGLDDYSGSTDKIYRKDIMEPGIILGIERNMFAENNRNIHYGKKENYFSFSQKENPKFTNSEDYSLINENTFQDVLNQPLSTFSIDVDNASYSNIRRYLLQIGSMPPMDAVRIEEMINYFTYDYPQPEDEKPFSINTELSYCPWNPDHQLVHIGLQGKTLDYRNLKPSNLVFLLDVSGSMSDRNKLPLLIDSFKLLVDELSGNDRIAIVVYAGAAGLVLDSTPANHRRIIYSALDRLHAGGSTAGGAGMKLAYEIAAENYIPGGNNRVILATDGDFNVGPSSNSEMVHLIEEKRNSGIFLTITGFGMGNYKDSKMEMISNAGNGNYFYIDSIDEAEKVFVHEMRANLFTLAKDVKIQVEFNPQFVSSYRLLGYENRLLDDKDFNDDTKDAGELGAGHTVTAIYEIIPAGLDFPDPGIDNLKYQQNIIRWNAGDSTELLTVKLRYKKPNGYTSRLLEAVVKNDPESFSRSSENFRFSSAVAAFGMKLRQSEYTRDISYSDIYRIAERATGPDEFGYRAEFLKMINTCRKIPLSEND